MINKQQMMALSANLYFHSFLFSFSGALLSFFYLLKGAIIIYFESVSFYTVTRRYPSHHRVFLKTVNRNLLGLGSLDPRRYYSRHRRKTM